jgi:hypothetical protein
MTPSTKPHKKPAITSLVHYYRRTYGKTDKPSHTGPYAAIVIDAKPELITLAAWTPGHQIVTAVPHKSMQPDYGSDYWEWPPREQRGFRQRKKGSGNVL